MHFGAIGVALFGLFFGGYFGSNPRVVSILLLLGGCVGLSLFLCGLFFSRFRRFITHFNEFRCEL